MGGFLAKQMGAPIGTIVCATNENDAVHRVLSQGVLSFADNIETVSETVRFGWWNKGCAACGSVACYLDAPR
jgi:threonine synthase